MPTEAREKKREREDALFRRHLLEGRHLGPQDIRRAIRERARLAGKGADLTIYQVLLKLRLVDVGLVKSIFARIRELFTFCETCGSEVALDGSDVLVCPSCRGVIDPGQTRALTSGSPGERAPAPRMVSDLANQDDHLLGQLLGKCRIEEKVGQGGMGVVYRARHLVLDKSVAVKVLSTTVGRSDARLKRFIREARSMARVSHPNVIGIHDVVAEQELYAIVMDYCEGRDLGRVLAQEGPVDSPRALDYLLQAVRGLGALHGVGILHRDLKPENLMLEPSGTIRVMDMSLAREMEPHKDLTLTDENEILGTPYTMSPEQCTGRKLDRRSDIYSLGATFYQIVAGQRPFGGESAVDIILKHLFEEPVPPHTVKGDVSKPLSRVIVKMMAKRSEHRYPSCQELEADLLRVREGRSPRVRPRLSSGVRRRLARTAFLGAALLLVVAGAFLWAVLSQAGGTSTTGEVHERKDVAVATHPQSPPDLSLIYLEAAADTWERHKEDPRRIEDAIADFRRVIERCPDSEGARLAELRILEVEAERNRLAEAWVEERSLPFHEALDAFEFDRARELLGGLPEHLKTTEADRWRNESSRGIESAKEAFVRERDMEVGRVAAEVEVAQKEGNLARVVLAIDSLPGRFRRTREGQALVAQREEAVSAAMERWRQAEAEFRGLLAEGKLDEARGRLGGFQKLEVGPEVLGSRVLEEAIETEVARDRLMESERELESRLAKVTNCLLAWDLDLAEELLDQIEGEKAFLPFGPRIAGERRTVDLYLEVVDSALRTLSRLRREDGVRAFRVRSGHGEEWASFEGRVVAWEPPLGFLLEIPIEDEIGRGAAQRSLSIPEISPADVVLLARESMPSRVPRSFLAEAVFYLLNDCYDQAQAALEALPAGHGLDVADYQARIALHRAHSLLDEASRARDAGKIVESFLAVRGALALAPEDPRALLDFENIRAEFERDHLLAGEEVYDREPVAVEVFEGTRPASDYEERWAWIAPLKVNRESDRLRVVSGEPQSPIAAHPIFLKGEALADFEIEVSVSLQGAARGRGIGVFFRKGGAALDLRDSTLLYADVEGTWSLQTWAGQEGEGAGEFEFLAGGSLAGAAPGFDRPFTLVVTGLGNRIRACLDGTPLVDIEHAVRPQGSIGLMVTDGVYASIHRIRADRLVRSGKKGD